MQIASYIFLMLFLPLTLCLYWLIFRQPRQKVWVLLIASLVFYTAAGIQFTLLLLILSLATYAIARWMKRVWPGVVLNLAALAVFKYWDFGAENINTLAAGLGLPALVPLMTLALPLGISFYVFKHIGYLLSVSQGRYPATKDFLLFVTYSAFFPQISAGPISDFNDTGPQLDALPEKPASSQIAQGLVFISIGMAKKLLIADQLNATLQTRLFAPETSPEGLIWAWSSVLMFALQLYFDFSGYTDTVLGVGLLFGVTLPPNFNNPYLSTSPGEFWERWHISLSMWFRTYVFFPLSRSLLRRFDTLPPERARAAANLVTMGLVGLWHGATWMYVLWGLYHGLLLTIYALLGQQRQARVTAPARVLFLILVLIGWALFLSPDLVFAQNLFANMLGLRGFGTLNDIAAIHPYTGVAILIGSVLAVSGMSEAADYPLPRRSIVMVALGIITVVCLLRLGTTQQFLYAQF
jgi:alginate O-acetyltransferase complex protein AlgI